MSSAEAPTVHAWNTRIGLIEEYVYPPGRASAGQLHAHADLQICFSLDFPGRYTYRGRRHDVPAGAISLLDAWEPHAPGDPFDRDRPSHYALLYLDPARFRTSVDLPSTLPIRAVVRVDREIVQRFRRLHDALASGGPLEQDERLRELAGTVFGGRAVSPVASPASAALMRARDYIAANLERGIGLDEVAAVADLTPWHFARAFRARFGLPPHRFQLGLRIDHARRMLAAGIGGGEVAQRTGFADQSHFIRCFKRVTGMTPGRIRPRPVGNGGVRRRA
jgi:AraC-like DNA-binding protein